MMTMAKKYTVSDGKPGLLFEPMDRKQELAE